MRKLPVVSKGLKGRLWSIIVLVGSYLIYISLGDLIPQYWNWIGFRALERSILTLGFVVILLIALSGIALSERLTTLAVRDGLTGLYNQTFIKVRLQEEIQRSERYKSALSVMMIDLDDFKPINDRYGHVVGDRILRGFGELLQDVVRSTDISGRYGGEEFLIILPLTSCLDAAAAAERIRKEISLHPFRIGASNDKSCQITVSIGVYASPFSSQKAEEIIGLADAALYRAKKEGKNKVVVFIK
ncbi:MAG: GGDEF domain-containing protein [Acidobacteriota bacterium]|nr:GGDEF domain-containing protein [Acidobacteriota bacterium]